VYVDLYWTVPECYKMSTLPINVIGCSSHVVVRKWNPQDSPRLSLSHPTSFYLRQLHRPVCEHK